MSTNYYTLKDKHIGKRSAAGLYCWDCNITLCKGGNEEIHKGCNELKSNHIFCTCNWYDECPVCKGKPFEEGLNNSSIGRELGFNKSEYKKKKGVTPCSSFRWAIKKEELKKVKTIKDEYGEKITIGEFNRILSECPVQYFDWIGEEFS